MTEHAPNEHTKGPPRNILATRLFMSRAADSGLLHMLALPFWAARFIYYAARERSWSFLRFYPGYHGSTIPSMKAVKRNRDKLFRIHGGPDDGVDLNRSQQKKLLDLFTTYFSDFNPPAQKAEGKLYYYNNSMFGFSDAFTLYAMFRANRPSRVIEIGSGYSSALMLDISREFLPGTRFTFIDPYSQSISQVLDSRPEGHYELIRREAQEIELEFFSQLDKNDVLFIDTSHSLKIGSDLSAIFFSVLPALKPGVIVHIHDIFFPWEYPEEMIMTGRTYNEIYFVRAFMQYNDSFEILYNTSQMELEHPEYFSDHMPGYYKSSGHRCGQSLWLRKVR